MPESTDVLDTAKVSERPANKLASTNVTNELARAINARGGVFHQGVEDSDPPYPDRRFYLVWDSGPNGEVDFTNHVYWIREAYIVNPATDAITEPLKLKEIPVTDPKGEGRWLPATNLSERPKNVGGTEANGSHALPKGTPIFDVESTIDPKGTLRHFFRSGGAIRLKIVDIRTRGGVYKVYTWLAPTTAAVNFSTVGVISEAQLGRQGIEAHAINLAEMDQNTHDLFTGTPKAKIVWGTPSMITSLGDSLPVYEIFMYDWKTACS